MCQKLVSHMCSPCLRLPLFMGNCTREGSDFWTVCGYFIFLKLIEDVKSNTNCKTFSGKVVQINERDGGVQVEKRGPVPVLEWSDHSLPLLVLHCNPVCSFLLRLASLTLSECIFTRTGSCCSPFPLLFFSIALCFVSYSYSVQGTVIQEILNLFVFFATPNHGVLF